ncbi:histidine kinase [Nostoc sp. 3335mG]|nr:histidine kinase [Nostoc sp. 3335mG]
MAAGNDTARTDQRLATIREYRLIDAPHDAAQDDLVRLAAHVCAAPVALVTVIDADWQWFAAQVGTDAPGTSLDDAICTHALDAPDLLVIPDLSIDPRTCDSGIVTAGPKVRFYAGVPLRIGDGVAIGTLCVLDTAPRPEGLTTVQREMLLRLARQVVATLDLRRLLGERELALARIAETEAALSGNEQRWQRLFENLGDGFALGLALRGSDGRVIDWQFFDANPAWFALWGIDRETMLAKTGRLLDLAAPARWADDLDALLRDGTPVGFVHHIPSLRRWFRGHCFRIDDERFGAILRDITDERGAEGRQDALIRLGDVLRDCHDGAAVARVASTLVGETLDVAGAGFGRIDADRTRIEIAPDWAVPGVRSLSGCHELTDFGDLRDAIEEGEAVIVPDIATDPRTEGRSGALTMQRIGAFVIVPVRRDGRTVSAFMVYDHGPRRWTAEEVAFLRKVADRVEVGMAQVESEARQNLLIQELAHRLKNTLSMVQAIASQTLRGTIDREPLEAFERRLQALGVAHDVLVERNWVGADMRATIGQVLAVFGCDDRIDLSGPDVALGARAALALALMLHELGTNAVKYGALSNGTGRIVLQWDVSDGTLSLTWQERGGPPVRAPSRRGFGSKLLRLGLTGNGNSEVCFEADGVFVTMCASLPDLTGG